MSGNIKNALLISDEYFTKGLIKKTVSKTYETLTVKPGTIVFRGDFTEKKIPSGKYPVFFGDKKSALIYTRGAPEKLSAYKFTKAPKLFNLCYENLGELLSDETLTEDEQSALEMYLNIGIDSEGAKFPYIIPVEFLKGKENLNAKLYLNRRILNMICRMGYDGWLCLPGQIIQRNLVGVSENGERKYNFNPYNPEIAICNWASFMEPY